MNSHTLISVLGLVLVSTCAGVARADEADDGGEPTPLRMRPTPAYVPAPRGAFEIAADASFIAPTGVVSDGRRIQGVVGPGLELGLGLGYRVNPRWSVELQGRLDDSQSRSGDDAGDVRGAAALVGATYHLLPHEIVDPYVSLSTGLRFLVERPAGTSATPVTTGIDLARVQLGMDLRSTRSFGVSLFVASDFTTFLWAQRQSSFWPIGAPHVTPFLSGGVQGRFDVGGTREGRSSHMTAER